jgi:hypothetical protein
MSPRTESPRAAAAVGEKRQGSGKGIQMQIQQLASKASISVVQYGQSTQLLLTLSPVWLNYTQVQSFDNLDVHADHWYSLIQCN